MKRTLALVVLLIATSFFSTATIAQTGKPLWTLTPLTPTTVSIASNVTYIPVRYTVTNNSTTHTLMLQPVTGITQVTTGLGICPNPFTLTKGASCTLSLLINTSQIAGNISGGPVVCQQSPSGQPDPLQCYQPSTQEQCLNITKGGACNLGDSCGGGVVACLGGAPYLNLVAATTSPAGIAWGTPGKTTNATSPIDGASNTALIITNDPLPPAKSAAATCRAYTAGGYNDWYLPATGQLTCILTNVRAGIIPVQAITNYWTSNEMTATTAASMGIDGLNDIVTIETGKQFQLPTTWCVRNL